MKNLEKSLKSKKKAIAVLQTFETILSPTLYTCAVSTFICLLLLNIAPATIGFAIATGCSMIGLCGTMIAKRVLEKNVTKMHKQSINNAIKTCNVIIEEYQKSNSNVKVEEQTTKNELYENKANTQNQQNLEK